MSNVKELAQRVMENSIPCLKQDNSKKLVQVTIFVKSVQSALSDLKHPPERLQSQCNYRPFIT